MAVGEVGQFGEETLPPCRAVQRKHLLELVKNEQRHGLRAVFLEAGGLDLFPDRGPGAAQGRVEVDAVAEFVFFELLKKLLFEGLVLVVEADMEWQQVGFFQERHEARVEQGTFADARFGEQHDHLLYRHLRKKVAALAFSSIKQRRIGDLEGRKPWVAVVVHAEKWVLMRRSISMATSVHAAARSGQWLMGVRLLGSTLFRMGPRSTGFHWQAPQTMGETRHFPG